MEKNPHTHKKNLIIIGSGGHGRVIKDIALLNGYEDIKFLDDDVNNPLSSGKVAEYIKFVDSSVFFVAIGNNSVRERIQKQIESSGGEIVNLIHPAAIISKDVTLGKGIAIMAGTVINTGTIIEDGCIINTCSSVDHDCHIRAYVHVSVGAHLAGTIDVGERVFLCASATVINNVKICADCIIGANAVVVKDIEKKGTYMGVPARIKNEKCH